MPARLAFAELAPAGLASVVLAVIIQSWLAFARLARLASVVFIQ